MVSVLHIFVCSMILCSNSGDGAYYINNTDNTYVVRNNLQELSKNWFAYVTSLLNYCVGVQHKLHGYDSVLVVKAIEQCVHRKFVQLSFEKSTYLGFWTVESGHNDIHINWQKSYSSGKACLGDHILHVVT